MTRLTNTPSRLAWATVIALAMTTVSRILAQSPSAGTLLDALSISVQYDSVTVARGSLRFRSVRVGSEAELLATGIVVKRGLRISAELRVDTLYSLRRYVAESRDSVGRIVDRVQVSSVGGRVTLERVTPGRRMVREFVAQRDLMILDTAAVVPFVALAWMSPRAGPVLLLDVRKGTLTSTAMSSGAPVGMTIAEAAVTGTTVSLSGAMGSLGWWRDVKGRLLRVVYGARGRILRDDPPT